MKRVISGIQPSGVLHIGNYLGCIKLWRNLILNSQLSNNKTDLLFFIADLHSLTTNLNYDEDEKRKQINNIINTNKKDDLSKVSLHVLAYLIASGVNHEKCTIFLQSSIPLHTELQWILSCITPFSKLKTMIQFKEKKIDSVGIFSYPLLMTSDILLYKANLVPVGNDQKQHLELTRIIAERFNKMSGKEIFPLPDVLFSDSPKIMSLNNGNKKMSKSESSNNGIIYLNDSEEQIKLKIQRAKTDSIGTILYDIENRPEVSNLITIYSSLKNKSILEVEEEFKNYNTFEFKMKLSDAIIDEFSIIKDKAEKLLKKDKEFLLEILNKGAESANKIAEKTMNEIKKELKILNLNTNI